jgi:hypothetical protein
MYVIEFPRKGRPFTYFPNAKQQKEKNISPRMTGCCLTNSTQSRASEKYEMVYYGWESN